MVMIDEGPVELGVPDERAQPMTPARPRRVRRAFMRPRRTIVTIHRWTSIGLLAWLVVISVTGAWLVFSDTFEGWLNPGRYDTTVGDVGPQAATDAAIAAAGPESEASYVVLPRNGRGVYEIFVETPIAGAPAPAAGEEAPHEHATYYVDPGSATVNDRAADAEGATWWLYRGHMYLWQDFGLFGAFDPDTGWCRAGDDGAETGGVRGVVCDVLPDGMDMVGWLAVGFIVVLLSGFYVWYWPGVRRWATALAIKRGRGSFTFQMSLHKAIGVVVWIPLLVVAFTGIIFAFPNLSPWFENVTPARRDFSLWTTPEDAVSAPADGRTPLDLDGALAVMEEQFPGRAVQNISPPLGDDETATYSAWVTRGFDPWTRQGGAGNALVVIDQYSGQLLYDGLPSEGNVFDQVWDDWGFPLHTGDFGATTTRALWTGLALTPIALGVTGVWMNLIRRRKRARRRPSVATDTTTA